MDTLFESAALPLQRIEPTKEMPKSVFCELARIALFTELMDRTDDGRVIWDQTRSTFYDPGFFEAEYVAMHNDWITLVMEVPEGAVGVAMHEAAKHDPAVAQTLEEWEEEES